MANNIDVQNATGGTVTVATTETGSVHTPHHRDPESLAQLTAILAKIIAAPATEAKQDTLIAKDFATQTTLAAVLAKIIAAPATEAKQDTGNTSLASGLTLTGAVNETAPASDTASSGLNGRLQRIAQRITSLIGLVPSALENTRFAVAIGSGSTALTFATSGADGVTNTLNSLYASTRNSVFNGSTWDRLRGSTIGLYVIPPPSTTGTLSNVAGSASSVTLLAANTARLGGSIVNESTAILYIKLGSAASATSYSYALAPMTTVGGVFEIPPGYTGIITGIWASATGNARVTERTA